MRRAGSLLIVLAWAALAGATWADDKPAPVPIDPAEVARLLLSTEAEKQALAQDLLLERMRRGGDLGPFVEALTTALRGSSADTQVLTAALLKQAVSGTPEERARAVRLLAALGPSAIGRILDALSAARGPASESSAPAAAAAPPPSPPEPPSPSTPPPQIREEEQASDEAEDVIEGPAWRLTVHAVEAPVKESSALLGDGVSVRTGTVEDAAAWAEKARLLPDAATVTLHGEERGDEILVASGKARDSGMAAKRREYRKSVTQTKDGAWAVVTGRLRDGWALRAQVTPAGQGLHVELTPRRTEVGFPMPVVTVTPASNVGSIELDRPEWTTSSVHVSFDLPGPKGGAIVRADGLGTDSGRTLLLVLTIAPR